MSQFLYQKESSLKYWIVIPQWEVDNDKLLPLNYLLVSPHASAILQGGIFVFLAVGKSDSTLANVWTSARRWPTRALPSTSPSIWVQLSPSPLRQRTRVWPRTAQARPRRRQARLPSGEMPGARRPSWKEAKPCTCTCVHKCNICGNGFKSEAGVKIHKGKTHKNEELPEDY